MTIDEAKALTKLIKACKASGVSKMISGDLELEFGTGEAVKISVPATGEAVETPSAEQLKAIEEHVALQNNANDAAEELAQMAIDDPAQFEDLLVERELIDGGQREIEADNRRLELALQ